MNNFLIKRPIAVMMTFITLVVLGVVASFKIPVSLMPNIDIPEIIVFIDKDNESASSLEQGAVLPMLNNLRQLPGLVKLESESENSKAKIRLRFEHGTDIDKAYLLTNEKIDQAMMKSSNIESRPRVVKATVSDLPTFYIEIVPKEVFTDKEYLEFSLFAKNKIKPNIEQLKSVALADITGISNSEIRLKPRKNVISNLGLETSFFESLIKSNNIKSGSITLVDGETQFNLKLDSEINNIEQVKNIHFNYNGRVLKIDDIAQVEIVPKLETGYFLSGNMQAITMGVIKQKDARLSDLREELDKYKAALTSSNLPFDIKITRDQGQLLDLSMANLKQSLIVGIILAIIILFFFLNNAKLPIIIALSIPTALLITILLFQLLGLSINIISLSGMILGVGMMLDNSIIVIDNIGQHISNGSSIHEGAVKGTREITKPLLSSMLTTIAIFIPLIFLQGTTGALFYDQAMAVSIGLTASFFVSIYLTPVLYTKLVKNTKSKFKIKQLNIEKLYNKGFDFTFKKPLVLTGITILLVIVGFSISTFLSKEKLPSIKYSKVNLNINWNENINADENKKRCLSLIEVIDTTYPNKYRTSSYVGQQKFILNSESDLSVNQAKLFFRYNDPSEEENLKLLISDFINNKYQKASIEFEVPKNIFEQIFKDQEHDFVLKLRAKNPIIRPSLDEINDLISLINTNWSDGKIANVEQQPSKLLQFNREKLANYNIDFNSAVSSIRNYLNKNVIIQLRQDNENLPLIFTSDEVTLNKMLNEAKVKNKDGHNYSINSFVNVVDQNDFELLSADYFGKYTKLIPQYYNGSAEFQSKELKSFIEKNSDFKVDIDAPYIENNKMLKDMFYVMLLAISLLFLILASQFESLIQPLILLLELPIDIAAALLFLFIMGSSINLMSLIGIVVMSGIIINDSIIKIDLANKLYKSGIDAKEAIHIAGKRRLKSIVMTTLTTILALTPILFGSDMGSKLQKPLAITLIGGLFIGTLVSLYLVPLMYSKIIFRKKNN